MKPAVKEAETKDECKFFVTRKKKSLNRIDAVFASLRVCTSIRCFWSSSAVDQVSAECVYVLAWECDVERMCSHKLCRPFLPRHSSAEASHAEVIHEATVPVVGGSQCV